MIKIGDKQRRKERAVIVSPTRLLSEWRRWELASEKGTHSIAGKVALMLYCTKKTSSSRRVHAPIAATLELAGCKIMCSDLATGSSTVLSIGKINALTFRLYAGGRAVVRNCAQARSRASRLSKNFEEGALSRAKHDADKASDVVSFASRTNDANRKETSI